MTENEMKSEEQKSNSSSTAMSHPGKMKHNKYIKQVLWTAECFVHHYKDN